MIAERELQIRVQTLFIPASDLKVLLLPIRPCLVPHSPTHKTDRFRYVGKHINSGRYKSQFMYVSYY
jgi:hypothetical protein